MRTFFELRPKQRDEKEKGTTYGNEWLDSHESDSEAIMSYSTFGIADEEKAEEEIPFYLRHYTKKYPFGNVHMALRVGPLTIENGVAKKNNCQNFCDALINYHLFSSLTDRNVDFGKADQRRTPLYLMSFVCRKEAYAAAPVETKFDVPNGLTEEYLLKFRYGFHQDSDIVDSLQEYWHDWGAFGTYLYPFQDLFPWDCSEAFGRHPVGCPHCNISKHVWAFPYDSWSIIALHASRSRFLYAPPPPADDDAISPTTTDDEAWLRNRLTLLSAVSALTAGAAAMARTKAFRRATAWLHQPGAAGTTTTTTTTTAAHLDRLRLGGIHRAQPWSTSFGRAAGYDHFFVAEWAHLRRADRVAAYEALRDYRMEMLDIDAAKMVVAAISSQEVFLKWILISVTDSLNLLQ
ncbi:hypothetical protein UCDDS831_g00584 [Diplodia seriata]|uniref:Uncharacterized protein n=1 Tax=Diplodia seriata TaxID=420778 RepID=A0A0G2F0Q5_9PEZI|nr:hypothetical protein UCDDS831_g00584 [Diplodia seriata]